MTFYSMTTYLYHMNNELSITNKENILWEEKNLIEQKNNCLNNNEIGQKDIINDINKDLMKSQCRNIGKISGIYKIINKVDGKYYVGSSCGIINRWYIHKYQLNKNIHTNDRLQNTWNKYGENNFEFLIIEKCKPEQLLVIEQKYLTIAKKEKIFSYNLSFIADKIEMTEEIRVKISIKTKERLKDKTKHPKYDKKIYKLYNRITNEVFLGTRQDFILKYNDKNGSINHLISGKFHSSKGWTFNPNYDLKGNRGKNWTQERIKSVSEKFTGKNNPSYDTTMHNFIHKDGTKETCTKYELYRKYNLDKSALARVINGKQKHTVGWKLE